MISEGNSAIEMTNAELIDTIRELVDERFDLELKAKGIRKRIEGLENVLVQRMEADGQTQIKQSGTTVYLRRELGVGYNDEVDRNMIIQSLIESDNVPLLTINMNSIKAFMRERMTDETTGTWEIRPDLLPENIGNLFRIYELTKLGVRRS